MIATLSACVLGFTSGVRHALEPDHLAAVSTMVAGTRTPGASFRYALSWGAGHGAMLVLAGGVLALLRGRLPDAASDAFEMIVAVALVALGVRGLTQVARAREQRHSHAALPRLPFAIGLVHGLAGSGALAALVVASIPSPAIGLTFIAIYATGAALGMASLAGALGFPLARLARSRRAMAVALGLSALASLVVGVIWALPIVARYAG